MFFSAVAVAVAGISFFLFFDFFFLALGYFWLSASRDVLLLVPGLRQTAVYCANGWNRGDWDGFYYTKGIE